MAPSSQSIGKTPGKESRSVSNNAEVSLKLHPEAEDELFHDAAWYDDKQSGLGDDFLAEIHRWFGIISDGPHVWPTWPNIPSAISPRVQRVVTERFPYKIAYQALPNYVLVLAVAHASREPLYWAQRLKQ